MNDYAALEEKYIKLCDAVHKQSGIIFGLAGNGRNDDAAETAARLAQYALTSKQQHLMRTEQATGCDLNALRVNPSDTRRE